jgi:hypothetical protein
MIGKRARVVVWRARLPFGGQPGEAEILDVADEVIEGRLIEWMQGSSFLRGDSLQMRRRLPIRPASR